MKTSKKKIKTRNQKVQQKKNGSEWQRTSQKVSGCPDFSKCQTNTMSCSWLKNKLLTIPSHEALNIYPVVQRDRKKMIKTA